MSRRGSVILGLALSSAAIVLVWQSSKHTSAPKTAALHRGVTPLSTSMPREVSTRPSPSPSKPPAVVESPILPVATENERRDPEFHRYQELVHQMKYRTTIEPLLGELKIQEHQKAAFVDATQTLLDELEKISCGYGDLLLNQSDKPLAELDAHVEAQIAAVKERYEQNVSQFLTPEQMQALRK